MSTHNTRDGVEEIVEGLLLLEEKAGDFSADALIINSPRAEQYLRNVLTTHHQELQKAREEWQTLADSAEMLWVVLANVNEGDWTKQTPEWQEAAKRWRDNYFGAVAKKDHSELDQLNKFMTHNTREELIKELRMVANMINMGERIQWGRETTLMDKAADMLETLHQEPQKAREEERELILEIVAEVDMSYAVNDGRDSQEMFGGQMAASEIRRRMNNLIL